MTAALPTWTDHVLPDKTPKSVTLNWKVSAMYWLSLITPTRGYLERCQLTRQIAQRFSPFHSAHVKFRNRFSQAPQVTDQSTVTNDWPDSIQRFNRLHYTQKKPPLDS